MRKILFDVLFISSVNRIRGFIDSRRILFERRGCVFFWGDVFGRIFVFVMVIVGVYDFFDIGEYFEFVVCYFGFLVVGISGFFF